MGCLSRRAWRRPRSSRCRRHGRSRRVAVDPSRLLEFEDLGARRLSWVARQASPELSRRVRLSLQPTPITSRRLQLALLHRPRRKARHIQDVDRTGRCGISLLTRIAGRKYITDSEIDRVIATGDAPTEAA